MPLAPTPPKGKPGTASWTALWFTQTDPEDVPEITRSTTSASRA
jgi:hypothetical protein